MVTIDNIRIMNCKIFCNYNDKDLIKIKQILEKNKNDLIICDNPAIKDYFVKNGFKAEFLDEIFPIYSDTTFQIYSNTKKTLQEYEKACKNIKFREMQIVDGLIHYIRNDVLLFERIRMILEMKKNLNFIFEKFSPSYFSFKKLAYDLGYEKDELEITVVKDSKIEKIKPGMDYSNLEDFNKFARYKKYFSIYKKNIGNGNSGKISSLLQVSKKAIPFLFKVSKSKLSDLPSGGNPNLALESLKKKISKINPVEYGFFLSSDRSDLLEAHYKVFEQFFEKRIEFQIFTIDPVTTSFLAKKKFPIMDLFEDSYRLANILKHSDEGKELNKHLIQAAKKHGLTILYFENFNRLLLDGVYRALATQMIIEIILTKMKLKKGIIMDGTMLGRVFSTLAKKYNISTVSIEPLIVDNNAISSLLYKANKICIYGSQGKEVLKELGIEEDRIAITGNPKYDYITSFNDKNSKRILQEKYGVIVSKKLIAIALSRWHEKDEEWMSNLIKFSNKNNFEIIIKLHPRYKINSQDTENKIHFINENCKGKKFHLTFDIDLNLILSSADVIISEYSNVSVEGVLLGKPVVNVNFMKEKLEQAQNYHKFGAVLYLEDYDKFEKTITDILDGSYNKEELEKGRQKIIDMYNYNNDGKASERIFELIIN